LKCEPGNLEAAYLLGSLYYETGDYILMNNLFQEFLELYPEDKQLNQFLGLAYLSQNQYSEAFKCFEIVVKLLSEKDKLDLYSPEYLSRERKKSISEVQMDSFWLKRDPMFITGENERLLEHFGRFAYANLRFSVPKLNEEGWHTDRGKTYIRYGKPSQIIEYGKSHEFNAIYPPMQIWMYPQFQLAFSDEFWNGLYQFTEPFNSSISIFKERTNINYSLVAENVQAVIPERFDFSLPGGDFTSPYQIKFFKVEEQTQADILFGIPMDESLYYPKQQFETALFALNENQIPQNSFRDSLQINFDSDSAHIIENYSIRSFSFLQDAGLLSYSFEILNNTLQKGFVSRSEINVPNYSSDSLHLSDIILANQILPASGNDHFVKNDLNIIPNLLQVFNNNDTIQIYFEVYNLQPDGFGNVHFRIESSIKKFKEGGFFNKFFKPDQKSISVINEYSGKRTSEFIIQAIDLNNIEQGEYYFEITVRDDNGKTISRRKTKLIVLENLNN
jgi:GWxTD domain-containing protein